MEDSANCRGDLDNDREEINIYLTKSRQKFTPKYWLKSIKMFWQMIDFQISSYKQITDMHM